MILLAVSSICVCVGTRLLLSHDCAGYRGPLAHGAFWAMIGSLGAQIRTCASHRSCNIHHFGGVSAASVLGVPLANVIGQVEGWRTAFYCIAALSFGVAAAIFLTVPPLPGVKGINSASLLQILGCTTVQTHIRGNVAVNHSAFHGIYLYRTLPCDPAMACRLGQIAPLLFAFGIAGLAGNFLTGALIDNSLKTCL